MDDHRFSQQDIRALLFTANSPLTPEHVRHQARGVTRKFRLIRAHGLIDKQEGRNSYQLTENGRKIITTVQAALRANPEKLTQAA
jgi:hypothetical protein